MNAEAGSGAGATAGLVQSIIARDLDFSDRFQLRSVTEAGGSGDVNLALWKERGADWVLEGTVTQASGGFALELALHDAV